ncbi:hypothetical protein [Nonomuraea sp. NPDC005501]|uniref:hypothetical protein n=1 Tax=Nonomuraea sp. NPDC005501 TaxID=3156884 RepID=UPI0033ACC4C0
MSPGIDTTLLPLTFAPGPTDFTVLTMDGTTWVRDPRTPSPRDWHNLASVPGYPPAVSDVSAATASSPADSLLISVVTTGGVVAQTRCTLTAPPPPPGLKWGATYCQPFKVVSPT